MTTVKKLTATRIQPPRHGANPRRGRRLLWGSVLTLLAIGVCAEVGYRVWAARFPELLEIGTEIDGFLGAYSKDFQSLDASLVRSSYTEDARADFLGNRSASNTVDGVESWDYLPGTEADTRVGLEEQIARHFAELRAVEKAKFKLNRVHDLDEREAADIQVRFQVWGELEDGREFYDRGLLHMELRGDGNGDWQIAAQDVLEGARVHRPEQTFFADVSEDSGLDIALPAKELYEERIEGWPFSSVSRIGRGVAVADVDADEDLDVCVAGFAGAELFLNDGSGRFSLATASGLPELETDWCLSPLFADFDGDSDPDLFLLRYFGECKLLRNDGGRFVDVSEGSGLSAIGSHPFAAAVSDTDNDGILDLYIGRYGDAEHTVPDNLVGSVNGLPDQLLRGRGDFRFEDVTKEAGIDNTGWTLAVGFVDIDDDQDADLYAVNDFGANYFCLNDGEGHFEDRTFESGGQDIGNGMSVSFLDHDSDGDFDLYTSAIASNTIWFQGPAIHWILSRFLRTPSTFAATLGTVRTLASRLASEEIDQLGYKITQGNSLLRNQGDGTFQHVEEETGTGWAEWAWGGAAEDFDGDGDTDLYVANGFVSGPDKHDL